MAGFFQTLRGKVITIVVLSIFASVAALSISSYFSSSMISMDQATSSMRSILEFRASNLESQYRQIADQATSLAKIESLQKSMVNLKSGWKTMDKKPGQARAALLKNFVETNPHPDGEREKLIKPEGPSDYYYSAHEELQPEAEKLLAASPFDDLLMADTKGNVIYSYRKGLGFAENLADSAWSATGLGSVYGRVLESLKTIESDDVAGSFSGIRIGAESKAAEIYFAVPLVNLGAHRGTMIFRVRDQVIGKILAMAIPKDSSERATILTPDGGVLGALADGGLVPLDAVDFGISRDALATDDMTTAPLARPDGAAIAFNLPVKLAGDRYLMSESLLADELKAGSWKIAGLLGLSGTIVLVLATILSLTILGRLFAPLGRLAQATGAVAEGRLDIVIDHQERRDEIGAMSKALAGFRDSLLRQQDYEAQARNAQAAEEQERRRRLAQQEAEAASLQNVVRALGEGLDRMANGDLAFAIDTPFPPALESLRSNFNTSVASLSAALTAIGYNSNAVREGSTEMRESAVQLAERTERQSVSLSQAAAAIDAITSSVHAQMGRAEDAGRIAREANAGTAGSARIMQQTITAMEAIQGSSQQINSIISVIDEIAFQTNLLALNAGVEAARAGESGKGFAVVAQEVRELAQRSARAAKEITDLLGKSTKEVDAGVGLVEKAGAALKEIGSYVDQINIQISAMREATRSDVETLREINSSVTQLEAMTQQNATMVEESTASIHRLAQEAGEMDARLGQFRLAEEANAEKETWRRAG